MTGMAGLEELFREMSRKKNTASSTKRESTIKQGVVHGQHVTIGSKNYSYTAAVDINIVDGMYVWCEITSGGIAVIVGA